MYKLVLDNIQSSEKTISIKYFIYKDSRLIYPRLNAKLYIDDIIIETVSNYNRLPFSLTLEDGLHLARLELYSDTIYLAKDFSINIDQDVDIELDLDKTHYKRGETLHATVKLYKGDEMIDKTVTFKIIKDGNILYEDKGETVNGIIIKDIKLDYNEGKYILEVST
ncbi:MAG: hypothetical protein QXO37_02515 [Candidatus Nitrosocaldaceae archaeon]